MIIIIINNLGDAVSVWADIGSVIFDIEIVIVYGIYVCCDSVTVFSNVVPDIRDVAGVYACALQDTDCESVISNDWIYSLDVQRCCC